MSPKARAGGKYRASIRINGRRIEHRFTKKADAESWYAKMLSQKERARAGMDVPFEPIPIENFCANFILARKKTHETWELDETRIRLYVLPFFGPSLDEKGRVISPGREIHSITRKEWKTWLDALVSAHGLSEKTHNNIRALIHRLYVEACEDEPPRAAHNPISAIQPRNSGEKEIEIFERLEDMHAYLDAMEALDLSAWCAAMIALNTGMREGEISALDWADVSLTDRTIRVTKTWSHARREVKRHTKTKDQRTIGMNEGLASAIAHYAQKTGKHAPRAPLCTLPDGRRMPGDSILTRHREALERAKLRYVTFHATRHTFATHFLAAGGSVWDLKNILGHASVTTTERYAHRLQAILKGRAGVFQVQSPSLRGLSPIKEGA